MSVGGLAGGELRALFALIGHNIAGDPAPPEREALPPPASPRPAPGDVLLPAAPTPAADGDDAPFGDAPFQDEPPRAPLSATLAGLRRPSTLAPGELTAALSMLRSAVADPRAPVAAEHAGRASEAGEPAFAPDASPAIPTTAASFALRGLGSEPARFAAGGEIRSTAQSMSPSEEVADLAGPAPQAASTGQERRWDTPASVRAPQPPALPQPADAMENRPAGALHRADAAEILAERPLGEAAPSLALPPITADAEVAALQFSLSEFLSGSAGVGAGAQAERAGVIASFILNAAMIPGWPPPRPIEGVPARAAAFVAARRELSEAEREFLLLVGKLLHGPGVLERLLRILEQRRRRSKLLAAFALILTQIEDFAAEVMAEFERMDGMEAPLPVAPAAGRRERLVLR